MSNIIFNINNELNTYDNQFYELLFEKITDTSKDKNIPFYSEFYSIHIYELLIDYIYSKFNSIQNINSSLDLIIQSINTLNGLIHKIHNIDYDNDTINILKKNKEIYNIVENLISWTDTNKFTIKIDVHYYHDIVQAKKKLEQAIFSSDIYYNNLDTKQKEKVDKFFKKLELFNECYETKLKINDQLKQMIKERIELIKVINVSHIRKHNEIICVGWVITTMNGLVDNKIIPGDSDCYPKKRGSNYWWGNWGNSNVFIYNKHILYKYNLVNHKYNIIDVSSVDIISDGAPDLRLGIYGGKILIYNTNLSEIFIYEDNKKFHEMKQYKRQYFSRGKLKINTNDNIKEMDYDNRSKNLTLLSFDDTKLEFLDWFYYDTGIVVKTYTINNNKYIYSYTSKRSIINFKHYKLDGKGSYLKDSEKASIDKNNFGDNYGKMPLWSFGTPVIDVDEYKVGVGHIKIYNDTKKYKYVSDSKIDIARTNLQKFFEKKFGEKYIPHFGSNDCAGYIYMAYFYKLKIKQENSEMFVSDAFLPLFIDDDYKFTLFFPIGISKLDNKFLVSGGYGDYKNIFIEFDDVLSLCYHDISNLNMEDYNYLVLQQDGKQKEIIDFGKPNTIGGSDAQYFKKKYMKYKIKYLNKVSLGY